MGERRAPVHLAGHELVGTCHACAFFHSREEALRVLLPFAREGVAQDERTFQIVDPRHRDERIGDLRGAGIDVEDALARGQLEVAPWEEAYLRGGQFRQEAMLELIQRVLRDGRTRGFQATRLWADMEWALEELPGVSDLIEYEAKLNHVLPQYDDVVVCSYDLSRFGAGVVMDILRTHPMVIIGGTLQENPFYVPPDEFLLELHERDGVGRLH